METYSFVVSFPDEAFSYPMAMVFAMASRYRAVFARRRPAFQPSGLGQDHPSMKAGNPPEAMKIAERSHSALGTVLCYGLSRVSLTGATT
jgi:hypothetical protein